jgi:hypothetical protein
LISGFPLSDKEDPREVPAKQNKRKKIEAIVQPVLHGNNPNNLGIQERLVIRDNQPQNAAQNAAQDHAVDSDSSSEDEEVPLQAAILDANQGEELELIEADGYTALFKSSILLHIPTIINGVFITLDVNTNILSIDNNE